MQSFKILVVDDFEPFRRWVCSILRQRAEFQVIEASDGLEAIQKADEAQPDLILFDIGLPRLNGIEAAKRLRQSGHSARILFLSQESSPEVVQETFRLGARGYVHKLRTQSELLLAVKAVCRGQRFVSSGLQRHKPNNSSTAKRTKKLEVPASKRRGSRERARRADAPKYPWQRAVIEALQSPRESLPQKINIAERTIAERLTHVAPPSIDERLALKNALRSLRVLNAETRPPPETSEKKKIA